MAISTGGAGGRYFKMKQGTRKRLGPSWGVTAGSKPRSLPIRARFNSGPTPRDAILDLMAMILEDPRVCEYIDRRAA